VETTFTPENLRLAYGGRVAFLSSRGNGCPEPESDLSDAADGHVDKPSWEK